MAYLAEDNWNAANERYDAELKEHTEQIRRIAKTLDSIGFSSSNRITDVFAFYLNYEEMQHEPVEHDERGRELRAQYLNQFEAFIGQTAEQIRSDGAERYDGLTALADFLKNSAKQLNGEKAAVPAGPDEELSAEQCYRLKCQGQRSMALLLADPFKNRHPEFSQYLSLEEEAHEMQLSQYYSQLATAASWRYGKPDHQAAGRSFFEDWGSRINGKSFYEMSRDYPEFNMFAETNSRMDAMQFDDELMKSYMNGEAPKPYTAETFQESYEGNRKISESMFSVNRNIWMKHAAESSHMSQSFYYKGDADTTLLAILHSKNKNGLTSAQKDAGEKLFDSAFTFSDVTEKLTGSQDNLWKTAVVNGVRFDDYLRLKYKNEEVSSRSAKCEFLAAVLQGEDVRLPYKPWSTDSYLDPVRVIYKGDNPELKAAFSGEKKGPDRKAAERDSVLSDESESDSVSSADLFEDNLTFRPLQPLTATPKDMVWLYRNRGKMTDAPARNIEEGNRLYKQVLGDIPMKDVYIDGKKAIDHVMSLSSKYTEKYLNDHPAVFRAEIMGAATGARNHVDFIRREKGNPEKFQVEELTMDLSVLNSEKHFYDDSRAYRAAKLRTDGTINERHRKLYRQEEERLEAEAQETARAQQNKKAEKQEPKAEKMSFDELQNLAGPRQRPGSRRNSAVMQNRNSLKKESSRKTV